MVYSASKNLESQINANFFALGPATRCDEIRHLALILKFLETSQTIAAYRRYLLQNRSSVASQLPTMECFHILLRCPSQR